MRYPHLSALYFLKFYQKEIYPYKISFQTESHDCTNSPTLSHTVCGSHRRSLSSHNPRDRSRIFMLRPIPPLLPPPPHHQGFQAGEVVGCGVKGCNVRQQTVKCTTGIDNWPSSRFIGEGGGVSLFCVTLYVTTRRGEGSAGGGWLWGLSAKSVAREFGNIW